LDFADAVGAGAVLRPPLPDVLHRALPNLQPWRAVPEALHLLPVLYFSAQLLFHLDQRSLDAFRTFLWVHGSLMVMRAVAFASTLLPDASRTCQTSRYLGSCFDLIFSGHVVMMILPLLGQATFFPYTPRAVALSLRACAAATCVLVAATRNHYTVDVLLAVLLTPLAFNWWITTPQCRALGAMEPCAYSWSVLRRGGGGEETLWAPAGAARPPRPPCRRSCWATATLARTAATWPQTGLCTAPNSIWSRPPAEPESDCGSSTVAVEPSVAAADRAMRPSSPSRPVRSTARCGSPSRVR
jgi:hypothetical protein